MEIDILQIQEGLYVLTEEGINVLHKDSIRFGLSKEERRILFDNLVLVSQEIQKKASLALFVKARILKQLTKQSKAQKWNLWEIRDEGNQGRLIFVRLDPDVILF